MRRSLVLLLLLLWAQTASGQAVTTKVDTENSVISYTGDAVMHKWTGVSNAAAGTLVLDMANPANSRIEIAAPVESFDSGNSNRDSNMLDIVDVDRYPEVRFVSTQIERGATAEEWRVRGDLTLHGQTRPIDLPVRVSTQNGVFMAEGSFDASITDFGMRRPKIMLVRVGDTITVEFTICAPLNTIAR